MIFKETKKFLKHIKTRTYNLDRKFKLQMQQIV